MSRSTERQVRSASAPPDTERTASSRAYRLTGIVNLPDLSLTPRSLASPDGGLGATSISCAFDGGLVASIDANFAGVDISVVDAFTLIQNAVGNSGLFGLFNVTQPCFDAAAVPSPTHCSIPGDYLFWDDIQPNESSVTASLGPPLRCVSLRHFGLLLTVCFPSDLHFTERPFLAQNGPKSDAQNKLRNDRFRLKRP